MSRNKIIKLFVYLILFVFVMTYIVSLSGYYEYNLQSSTNLTKESIQQFEKDVREGKDIDINDYTKKDKVDYSNNLTNATARISLEVNDYIRGGIKRVFNHLNKIIND